MHSEQSATHTFWMTTRTTTESSWKHRGGSKMRGPESKTVRGKQRIVPDVPRSNKSRSSEPTAYYNYQRVRRDTVIQNHHSTDFCRKAH